MYFPHPQPIDGVLGISSDFLGVVTTTILGILAIFGDQVRNLIFRPNLQPADKPVMTVQLTPFKKSDGAIYNEKFLFHRLPIKNIGRVSAREVRVLLTYTQTAENFIPVPLNWTHWNKSTRDISAGETAYLDILKKREVLTHIEFCWSSEAGTPVEPRLAVFDPRLGSLHLEFFERNRKVGDITLQFLKDKGELRIL